MSAVESYPQYALSERIADGVMHGLGIGLTLAGTIGLLIWGIDGLPAPLSAALVLYAVTLILSFVASGCYHMSPWPQVQPLLRRFDHAAIYILIAGTMTPIAVMAGSPLALTQITLVWVLALVGAARKVFWWSTPGRYGPATYLLMGLSGALLFEDLATCMPAAAIRLLVTGGTLYVVGVIFFSWNGLKYANAIWHAFVLAASACMFAAIVLSAAALA